MLGSVSTVNVKYYDSNKNPGNNGHYSRASCVPHINKHTHKTNNPIHNHLN